MADDKAWQKPLVEEAHNEPAPNDGIAVSKDAGVQWEASIRSSLSHWEPEPGFAHVDGEIAGSGYNETKTDIIAVPCPGASPVETWMREPLPDGYFGHPTKRELDSHPALKDFSGHAILSPAINRTLPRAKHLWVRHGIRREANSARVMLYRHRELREGLTLDDLAEDLLDQLHKTRDLSQNRPLFFICHSIGGLVAKLALAKASERENMRWLIFHTHGMTFFGTKLSNQLPSSNPHANLGISYSSSRLELPVHAQPQREHPRTSPPLSTMAEVHHTGAETQPQTVTACTRCLSRHSERNAYLDLLRDQRLPVVWFRLI
ncbi:uncharacterized protein PG998_007137 [Apiospora kogelbergensis]|uniref:uncharacterized protein n=1 Tax=Apiospora kogelbergensis TaxID=1337665 RepID=UPI003130CEC0